MNSCNNILLPVHLIRLGTTCFPLSLRRTLPNLLKELPNDLKESPEQIFWTFAGSLFANYLQEAGPVFAKFGQILSTREDLIPENLAVKLSVLFDKQDPLSADQILKLIESNYERNPFASVNLEPLGVGTVGQVHAAELKDGSKVVIKILKPGLKKKVARDIEVINFVLHLYQKVRGQDLSFAFHSIKDLEASFYKELDLSQEASSLLRFSKRMKKNPKVVVPKFYAELSDRNILVMEKLEGDTLASFKNRKDISEAEKKHLADTVLSEVLQQIFSEGDFHGDPHGGNFVVLKDGRIGMIDLGLTGGLDPNSKAHITKAIRAIVSGNPDLALRSLLSFGVKPNDFDYLAFKEDVATCFAENKPKLKSQGFEQMVSELFKVAHQHGLFIPSETAVLIKSLVTIEGLARGLDPGVNIAAKAIPVVMKSGISSFWDSAVARVKSWSN